MAKPPCKFTIVRSLKANGDIEFATNPPFPSCTVHIEIDGELVGTKLGSTIGDYFIVQVAHDSVIVRPLKPGAQAAVVIEVDCANCGPTREPYGSRDPSRFSLATWAAILFFPFLILIWIGRSIKEQIAVW
jgi:hypothetical protein